jgi:hypothetical protein
MALSYVACRIDRATKWRHIHGPMGRYRRRKAFGVIVGPWVYLSNLPTAKVTYEFAGREYWIKVNECGAADVACFYGVAWSGDCSCVQEKHYANLLRQIFLSTILG